MNLDFDMELLYKMAPKSTIKTLRARLEIGRSIPEIVHDFRLKHGLTMPAYTFQNKAATSQA
jgi:hypothetical protein